MSRGRAFHRLLAIGAVVALIAAACSEDEGAAPIEQIIVLAEDIPAGLNYDGPAVPLPPTQTGLVNLMETLIDYAPGEVNEEGVQLLDFTRFEPRLAESWEFDEETLTWTFHLREDVTGCNGATFDADDVLYTFARSKSASGEVPAGWFTIGTASVDGFDEMGELGDEVTKVDDFTVQIRQSAPNQLFLPVMTHFALGIFDKETMEAHATDDDPWSHEYTNTEDVPSFGPYCLERWEKEREFVVSASPDYYRGEAPIKRIVYRKVPQSANRVAALRSGDAHLVEHLTPKEFDTLRDVDGVNVAGVVGNETLYLHLNWSSRPFDDVRVRQAIAHSIPYEEVIANGYFGQAKRWEGQVPSSAPGYHRPETQYEYDPDRARELLAEAGFPNGEGLDAFADAFRLSYVAEKESTLGPIATILQAALNDVGFPFELDPIPNSQFADRMFVRRDLPAALNDQEKPVVVEAGYSLQIWHLSLENGAVANNNNYVNPEVDELILAARDEGDPDVRNQMLADAQELVHQDVNFVPIVEWRTQWAFSESISGVTWHPENSLRWYELRVTGE